MSLPDPPMLRWIGLGGLFGLVIACFAPVLFLDEQFAFRDAAHFYYPLYQVVQRQWASGHVPLWNPWENGGMPMLGNPTAAVLYPGKLLFAPFPYAWGVRVYTIAHVLLAVGSMYGLMRHWTVSRAGSIVSALSYGFGGPILFQYCNIIFLVGAAWLPLGLLAVDRLVRLRQPRALSLLAIVLAMQTLGGDPQAAYLLGLCAGGYAIGLSRASRPSSFLETLRSRVSARLGIALALLAWVAATLAAAYWLPALRPPAKQTNPMPPFPWTPFWPKIMLGLWAAAAVTLSLNWKKRPEGRLLLRTLAFLLGAAGLAGLLSAAQLLPVLEFSGLSVRASREASHEIYAFSLEPYRLLEFLWPNVFAFGFGKETGWIALLPPWGGQKIWVYSLYMGIPALILGLSAFGLRRGPSPKVWLSLILLISLLGALGTYGSPIFHARFLPALAKPAALGPPDEAHVGPIRLDGKLRGGDGGPYWLMSAALPGFDGFRYPSKLLTFSALALAGLAGFGWDGVREGQGKRAARWTFLLVMISIATLVGLVAARAPILAWFAASPLARNGGGYGPIDPAATWAAIAWSVAHGLVALGLFTAVLRYAGHPPRLARAEALFILLAAADLALANRSLIFTAPQAHFAPDRVPKALARIAEAEAKDPAEGPYRIHRMPTWSPLVWRNERSDRRGLEFVEWERDTLQPKYGLLEGVHYTETVGTAELFDVMYFFGAFERRLRADTAARLGVEPDSRAVIYPRRGFDLWNSRYFILPIAHPGGWTDEFRGYAAFLPRTTTVFPVPVEMAALSPEERDRFVLTQDYQILRNEQAMPRAWIVHDLRFFDPIVGLRKQDRTAMMNELLYPADEFWTDERLTAHDPRRVAWIEARLDDRPALNRYRTGPSQAPGDAVAFVSMEPERVVLRANLGRPGVLVLADAYYPGWRLAVDGKPAEILRANRAMRGVALESGPHDVVFTFKPSSYRVGVGLTILGLAVVIGSWVVPRLRGRNRARTGVAP